MTATRRPPSTTEPGAVPWRLAVRSGSLACLAPTVVVSSSSIISAMTRKPTATLMARRPSRAAPAISPNARRSSSDSAGNSGASSRSTTRRAGTFLLIGGGPLPVRMFLAERPTYQKAGLRRGTATSLQQAPGQPRSRRCAGAARGGQELLPPQRRPRLLRSREGASRRQVGSPSPLRSSPSAATTPCAGTCCIGLFEASEKGRARAGACLGPARTQRWRKLRKSTPSPHRDLWIVEASERLLVHCAELT